MRAPARLALYALALVVAFAATFGIARAVVPTEVSQSWAAPEADHESETGGEHGGDAAEAERTAADPVPGLASAQDGYQLRQVAAPTAVGEKGTLSFTLTGPGGSPLTDYEVSHDKDLHLIVVRSDGEGFRHVHPETDGAGSWTLPWTWEQAGSHRLYADFVPAETGAELTLTSTIDVAGELSPATNRTDSTSTTVDGFTVDLAGEVTAGAESMLTFTVKRGGQPVTTLQPYLDAYGHLVALRSGDLGYLHVHPMGAEPDDDTTTSGPRVEFMAEAPSPGQYLLYLDFQIDGQVRTAEFTVTAR